MVVTQITTRVEFASLGQLVKLWRARAVVDSELPRWAAVRCGI